MKSNNQLDLGAMRIAASQREWNSLQDILKRLLAELDPLIAMQVAVPHLQGFLPTFETYYSEAGWVRELLLTVISYASAPNELPEATLPQFNAPGCGNFLLAVFDVSRAVQDKYTVFERYSHLTNAVANAILAKLQHHYYSQHPTAFEQLRDPETDQATIKAIQASFWLDEGVAQADTETWMTVIDDLQRLFVQEKVE